MLKVYNSASRTLEEFAPREPGKVRMYVCGLTVYNDMHLGHARSYVAFDAIRRWLEHSGYAVEHVQNHTDIDDKIIARAAEVTASASSRVRRRRPMRLMNATSSINGRGR